MNKNRKNKPRKLWNNVLIRHLCLSLGLALLLVILSNIFLDVFTLHGKSFPVPDFTGKTLDSVAAIAKRNKLRIEIIDSVFRIDAARGSVFIQNPEPGMHVKVNRKVFLTMNSFAPRKETVPNVMEISLRQAKTELNAKGFRVGKLEYSSQYPYVEVFRQMYRGQVIEPGILLPVGEYIDLLLGVDSLSTVIVSVPDVIGLNRHAVEDIIIDNSLNYELSFDRKVKTLTDSLNSEAYEQYPPAESFAQCGETVSVKLRLPEKK
jgi:beta-lactam-binding protein with PASTA domain